MNKTLKLASLFIFIILGVFLIVLTVSVFKLKRDVSLDLQSVYSSNKNYSTEARYLALNFSELYPDINRVIILGSSNSRMGLRPNVFKNIYPTLKIHNISIGGANIYELLQITNLYYKTGRKCQSTFILGISYLNFSDNATLWGNGETEFIREMVRSGIYLNTNLGLIARFNFLPIDTLENIYRPFVYMHYLTREVIKHTLGSFLIDLKMFFNHKIEDSDRRRYEWQKFQELANDNDLNAVVLDLATQKWLLSERLIDAGGKSRAVGDEQFLLLGELLREVQKHGDNMVIVDLPLPKWHTDKFEASDSSYRIKLRKLISENKINPNLSLIDLHKLNDGHLFYDSAHPKPITAINWSTLIGERISSVKPVSCFNK